MVVFITMDKMIYQPYIGVPAMKDKEISSPFSDSPPLPTDF